MQFKRVHSSHLEAGKKYKICQHFSQYRGTYLYSIYGIHTFVNINGQHNFQDYMYDTTFYEPIFQREHIQSIMEERALQLVLKSIIGDPTFTWPEPTVPQPSIFNYLYLQPT
jgi:hypothetical protein